MHIFQKKSIRCKSPGKYSLQIKERKNDNFRTIGFQCSATTNKVFKGFFGRFNASPSFVSPFSPTSSCKKKVVAQRGEPNAVSPPALMILTTLDSQVILLEIEDLVLHTLN